MGRHDDQKSKNGRGGRSHNRYKFSRSQLKWRYFKMAFPKWRHQMNFYAMRKALA
jgi:hypothetical protein